MLAVYAFVAFEWLFFAMGLEVPALRFIATMPMGWLLVMGGFMLVSMDRRPLGAIRYVAGDAIRRVDALCSG